MAFTEEQLKEWDFQKKIGIEANAKRMAEVIANRTPEQVAFNLLRKSPISEWFKSPIFRYVRKRGHFGFWGVYVYDSKSPSGVISIGVISDAEYEENKHLIKCNYLIGSEFR